jgi:hypothetical protein
MPLDHERIYLGFDPGGSNSFGVAISDGDRIKTSTVGSVDCAIKWTVRECQERRPIAAGIDTMLHWATGKSGMRPCDWQLRAKYPPVRDSIMAPNSLYGAMAIGGIALALKLRHLWPELLLNETHPKVLLYERWGKGYDSKVPQTVEAAIQWFVHQGQYIGSKIEGEHELDAALSAWATQKGLAEDWVDIIGTSDGLLFPVPGEKVRYLWPKNLVEDTTQTPSSAGWILQQGRLGSRGSGDTAENGYIGQRRQPFIRATGNAGIDHGSAAECEIKMQGEWRRIGVTAAVCIGRDSLMRCAECHGRVRVHKAGTTGQQAHFEHYTSHTGCSLTPRNFSGHRSLHPNALP